MPLQPKNITEGEYVDYTCIEKGPSWSLLGEYIRGEDFVFDDSVDIVDGKLRIKCIRGVTVGTLGKVNYIFRGTHCGKMQIFVQKKKINFHKTMILNFHAKQELFG